MIEDLAVFRDILPDAAFKIAFALLCGILLGAEREIKNKPAGLRTIVLITIGAAFFMIVGDLIARVTEGPSDITRVDTSRVAAHVVSGIGFLGGGAIIQSRASIHGLTTAATIWVAAGIGLSIGLGFPILAMGTTLVVLLVLVVLDPVRAWMSRRGKSRELALILPNDSLTLERVISVLLDNDIPERNIRMRHSDDTLRLGITYRAWRGDKQDLLNELAEINGVRGAAVESSSREMR
jgi:putative Mg2+ transporter-C (MgtC) family protein